MIEARSHPIPVGPVIVDRPSGMSGRRATAVPHPSVITHRPSATGSVKGRSIARDGLIVALGGQVERVLGIATSLALRRLLDPDRLGVYAGLRLYLDNTNRSSLGIGLGAVQEIPILRASGRPDDARRAADVAATANALTCSAYAAALAGWAWWHAAGRAGDPLAAEWTWGLAIVALLAILQRHMSFRVAVLRAHGEFALTAGLDVIEAVVFAIAATLGLALVGIWGLWAAVGLVMVVKIAYLRARHPLRFAWDWDPALAWRLMRTGLPILANTAAFGAVANLDRALILWRVPDGERALGLYSVALLGTSWSLDLAGRLVTVLYTHFQTTLGRTRDPAEVARQAARATEAQAPALAAGAAVAYLIGPAMLGWLLPRYADGLPALRPLMPGMVALGLAWPSRQMLIAVGRPYRLCLATLAGLALTAAAGIAGADAAGIVGVARGMSLGFASVYLLTSATALVPDLGWRGWGAHQSLVLGTLAAFAAAAVVAAHPPMGPPARGAVLVLGMVPPLWLGWRRFGWGRGGRAEGGGCSTSDS